MVVGPTTLIKQLDPKSQIFPIWIEVVWSNMKFQENKKTWVDSETKTAQGQEFCEQPKLATIWIFSIEHPCIKMSDPNSLGHTISRKYSWLPMCGGSIRHGKHIRSTEQNGRVKMF